MKVVYISSEISPYASTGGLADVAGALPKALAESGLDVCRIMPMYRPVYDKGYSLQDTGVTLKIPVGFRTYKAHIRFHEMEGIRTYFVERDEFFDRRELYSLPDRDYEDNFERFIFFQKAAVALMDELGLAPDIVHSNDWQGGLVPAFLEHGIQGIGRAAKEKTVFTIHNLAYQGIFPGSDYAYTNLPFSCFSIEQLEFYGNVNCLKGGVSMADRVTTVSRRYAEEILQPEFGCGLDGYLTKIQDRLHGIVNGVDYSVWDPQADSYLARTYGPDDLSGKAECKKDLLKVMKLDRRRGNRPLIGMVSRMVDHKGFDLLVQAMPEIMKEDVSFVLLGSGMKEYHEAAQEWSRMWPGRFGVYIGYNDELSHKIEGGADIFLMPSKFEPCGLNQIYSLRYGTVPIVHAVGGLDDTIQDVSEDGTGGNGFKFNTYTSDDLLASLRRALQLYRKPDAWRALQRRGMKQDYSWTRAAKEYIAVYENIG